MPSGTLHAEFGQTRMTAGVVLIAWPLLRCATVPSGTWDDPHGGKWPTHHCAGLVLSQQLQARLYNLCRLLLEHVHIMVGNHQFLLSPAHAAWPRCSGLQSFRRESHDCERRKPVEQKERFCVAVRGNRIPACFFVTACLGGQHGNFHSIAGTGRKPSGQTHANEVVRGLKTK